MGAYQIQRKAYCIVCDKDGVVLQEWQFRVPSFESLYANLSSLKNLLHAYFIRDQMEEDIKVMLYFRPYIKPLSIEFPDIEPLDAIDISDLNDLKNHLKDFGYAKSK